MPESGTSQLDVYACVMSILPYAVVAPLPTIEVHQSSLGMETAHQTDVGTFEIAMGLGGGGVSTEARTAVVGRWINPRRSYRPVAGVRPGPCIC